MKPFYYQLREEFAALPPPGQEYAEAIDLKNITIRWTPSWSGHGRSSKGIRADTQIDMRGSVESRDQKRRPHLVPLPITRQSEKSLVRAGKHRLTLETHSFGSDCESGPTWRRQLVSSINPSDDRMQALCIVQVGTAPRPIFLILFNSQ